MSAFISNNHFLVINADNKRIFALPDIRGITEEEGGTVMVEVQSDCMFRFKIPFEVVMRAFQNSDDDEDE